MSKTYSIACIDCKKQLWIAQGSGDKGHVYASPIATGVMYDFLSDHRGHQLQYNNSDEFDFYEEKNEPMECELPYQRLTIQASILFESADSFALSAKWSMELAANSEYERGKASAYELCSEKLTQLADRINKLSQ